MTHRLALLRHKAFSSQSHRCFYCHALMWETDPTDFMSQYSAPPNLVKKLQCTAEHLKPRSEGGQNVADNIVAACAFCNHTRHRAKKPLEPSLYFNRVQSRVARGHWLQIPSSLRQNLPSHLEGGRSPLVSNHQMKLPLAVPAGMERGLGG